MVKVYDIKQGGPAKEQEPEYPFGRTLDEMDVHAFLNMRDWLEKAVTEAGATVGGAGVGMGQADLDIVLEGERYNISIRPRPKR